jgi:hypothetical protein
MKLFIILGLVFLMPPELSYAQHGILPYMVDTIMTSSKYQDSHDLLCAINEASSQIYVVDKNKILQSKTIQIYDCYTKFRSKVTLNKLKVSNKREDFCYFKIHDSCLFLASQFTLFIYDLNGNLKTTIADTNSDDIFFFKNYFITASYGLIDKGGLRKAGCYLTSYEYGAYEVKNTLFVEDNESVLTFLGTQNVTADQNNLFYIRSITGCVYKIAEDLQILDSTFLYIQDSSRLSLISNWNTITAYYRKTGDMSWQLHDSIYSFARKNSWLSAIYCDYNGIHCISTNKFGSESYHIYDVTNKLMITNRGKIDNAKFLNSRQLLIGNLRGFLVFSLAYDLAIFITPSFYPDIQYSDENSYLSHYQLQTLSSNNFTLRIYRYAKKD